jgi:putative hydrolase of HD superfamily
MGLKESLMELQEKEKRYAKISIRREVKKELAKIKKVRPKENKCIMCGEKAEYSIKGSNDWYCKDCAIEYFGDLDNLEKLHDKNLKKSTDKKKPMTAEENKRFKNFLKILEIYKLKKVPRNSSNNYFDEKDNVKYKRRETTAEHIYSSLRLADFFLSSEKEFSKLDKVKVYELLMYHDDAEIITGDIGIAERDKRLKKEQQEKNAVQILSKKYPKQMNSKIVLLDDEYHERITPESKFACAIDRMDGIIHELQYPGDWGPKGFDEKNTVAWFGEAFKYSKTFKEYFRDTIRYLRENGYFDR